MHSVKCYELRVENYFVLNEIINIHIAHCECLIDFIALGYVIQFDIYLIVHLVSIHELMNIDGFLLKILIN